MAQLGHESASGLKPARIAEWIELALYLADRILRLFGRRETDRPARQDPGQEQ